jgi:hypothetical protein
MLEVRLLGALDRSLISRIDIVHAVNHGSYPTESVLLYLIVQSLVEIFKSCISTCHYYVLEEIVLDVLWNVL